MYWNTDALVVIPYCLYLEEDIASIKPEINNHLVIRMQNPNLGNSDKCLETKNWGGGFDIIFNT
jgi:hypothetical protein